MAQHTASKLANILSFSRFCRGLEMPRAPLEIFLEISNVCDLKCAMCTEFSALNAHRFQFLKQQQRGFLLANDVETNMRQLLEGALLVHCSGYGEPTIHPNFKEFIAFISQFEVLISFITNGMHIDTELAEFIVEKNVSRIMVSMSGTTKEEYENIYTGGDFGRVLRGVELVAAAKAKAGKQYPRIEINSLAFQHHVARFDRFVEMMADAGANVVHLKKLQPYHHIPELFEHVSVMRPWVEGEIIRRAIEIGRIRGVHVACEQYVAEQVDSEQEYAARLQALQAEAEKFPPTRPFGTNAIDRLPHISKQQHPAAGRNEVATLSRATSEDEARDALNVGPLPELAESPFYCMEPFKTIYVRKDGAVKPCCFSSQPPFLGSIASQSGQDVWDGSGYRAFRTGIVAGKYPQDYCGRCVRERIGPPDHYVYSMTDEFVRWYSASHDTALEGQLELTEPNIYKILSHQNNTRIAAEFQSLTRASFPSTSGPIVNVTDEQLGLTKIEGRLEHIEADRAVGWAWLPQYPRFRVPVTVWANQGELAAGIACRPREDLFAAGKGDGYHGFSIPLPRRQDRWSKYDVSVTAGTSQPLAM